jgi:hypothetical protein
MSYSLEGSLLEVCDCNVLCPCWIGEDPDNGTCDAANTYHIDRGSINGIDVSGRSLGILVHIPGNVLQGNWKTVLVVDDKASDEQANAIVEAFSGKLGGPLADVASLIGEVVSIERAPIDFDVQEGRGTLRIGSFIEAEMEPYRSATGAITTLNESIFSTIPGSPAWVAKAPKFIRKSSQFGLKDMNIQGRNAIQGAFRFEAN